MSRGYGLLTVLLALVAGVAIGSNPRIVPIDGREHSPVQPKPAPVTNAEGAPTKKPASATVTTSDVAALSAAERELFTGDEALPSATPAFPNGAPLGGSNPPLDFLYGLVEPDLPVTRDPRVARYLQFFTQNDKGRAIFQAWLSRRDQFLPLFAESFRQQKLPTALEAVALVESGLFPKARSSAGAVGLWQLMPRTARAYGLQVDNKIDQRYDPAKATAAATQHLYDLYTRLHSWDLALAAYNAGTDNIENRTRSRATKSFWELANLPGGLPRETRLYVPKVLAVSVLLKNLATFGFLSAQGARSDQPSPSWARLGGGAAPALGTPALDLISMVADRDRMESQVELLPPRDSHAYLIDLGEAPDGNPDASRATAEFPQTYQVVRGDTLNKIAASLGVTPEELTNWNRIDNPSRLRVGQILKIHPGSGEGDSRVTVHLVTGGETLSDIARRFGVSEAELAHQNQLANPEFLKEGQLLRVKISHAKAAFGVQDAATMP